MRVETVVTLAACLLGASVPLAWSFRHWNPGGMFCVLPFACPAVVPFAVVAASAWSVRADRQASRVVAVVAVLVLAVGLGGWYWASQDREGVALLLAGLLFVPGVQLLLWLGGAVASGRRGGRAGRPPG